MGENICDRIVACAHSSKIRNIIDLEKETKWDGSNKFGDAIMGIIQKHYPSPPPHPLTVPSTLAPVASGVSVPYIPPAANSAPQFIPYIPPQSYSQSQTLPLSESNAASGSRPPRKKPTCSVCRMVGHTTWNAKQIKRRQSMHITRRM
ncbi:hypothetical protein M378DRAFT_14728 [Amanita muscaria Koide BX008]|uniref:Uncharacterized protein n=1 Tax=Amanita muscaria (strain Koide BX008) TaxID=946122 RepID=A0A0C2S9Z5_AMAMK|nr:hypothetical protein M378DRAFT_14728 [Amanita muscaria Koide BX008]